ncbi:MAG: Gfo/Idh/MocA family oxidoreductase, partial [Halocynthiibacter sp.]
RALVASIETHWKRGADYYAVPWRGTWAGEQGGAVLGHAIHAHDLLTHVFGPVRKVSAMTATRVNPIETEDCAAISFEMCNGALVTSSITLGAASDSSRLRFVFEHLTAESGTAPYAPASDGWTLTARAPENQARVDEITSAVPDMPSGFRGLLIEVARALGGEPSRVVTPDEGRRSIELVTAIYQSQRGSCPVELPLGSESSGYDGWQPFRPP